MEKPKKKVKGQQDESLAKKTSLAIGIMVAASLLVLIVISAILSSTFLTRSIKGEFEGVASKNGVMVQGILDNASSAAESLQEYIEDQYTTFDQTGYTGETKKSVLYDVNLQSMNKAIEEYFLNTAWSTVGNSDDISGMGIFFEPDAFDPGIKDYSIYVNDDTAKDRSCLSYGSYEDYGSQEYYTEAADSKTEYFTKPYTDQGNLMITAAYPIVHNDEVQGVIVVDINIANFSRLQSTDANYPSMYVDILMDDSTMVYDSESEEYIGQKVSDLIGEAQYKKIQAGIDTGESFSVNTRRDNGSQVSRFYYPISAGSRTWWAVSVLNKSDLQKNTVILVLMMAAIGIISVVVIVVMAGRLLFKYIKPIDKVVDASQQLKSGDFNIEIQAESSDEIGKLSDAFSDAAQILRDIIHDLKSVLKEMSENNFDIKPAVDYVGDFESIKESLYAVVADLSKTLNEINNVSEEVSSNADNISQGAQALTEGATDQASSVEELQATITNVSEEVTRNAESAKAANEMAQHVGEEIKITNTSMQEVVAAMETINETSMQINAIIASINDIASQTNLLALNASIEAARAGEAGKGFAVVATHVGELATQSAQAAKDSTDLIANTLQAVEKGKTLVDVAAGKLIGAADKTGELVSHIGEISAASESQATALSQLLLATDQIAAVVEENTAMAEESAASSEELAAQAAKLKDLIGVFKLYEQK